MLEKEAEEYASMYARQYLHNDGSGLTNSYCEVYNAYYQSAEPREKRIAELEAQIEKMKCCQNCSHLCARCELGIDGCYVCSKWKLRR